MSGGRFRLFGFVRGALGDTEGDSLASVSLMLWLHAPIFSFEILMGIFWLRCKKTLFEEIGNK